MKLWVGTSGYSYKQWQGSFYPEGLAAKEMLNFYAARLDSVEINNTFYRLPKESVLASWAQQVPASFRFTLKAAQKITHVKRLKDSAAEVEYLFRVSAALKSKLGAILFQLPPNLKKNLDRLQEFLSLLPSEQHIAFEFRHPSWFEEDVFACLKTKNCAVCIADTDEEQNPNIPVTATFGYLRLRRSEYSAADLLRWKKRVVSQPWDQAYVYFKHEEQGLGPKLAAAFLEEREK